jgi:ribonucleoside-diphosphate reductase alpha chain
MVIMAFDRRAIAVQDEFYDQVLREKYCKDGERSAAQVFARVACGLAEADRRFYAGLSPAQRKDTAARFLGIDTDSADAIAETCRKRYLDAMDAGFIPAGRIMSACGTNLDATLINCFVQPVGDAISEDRDGKVSIYKALLQAAETMRRGGGVGYDFSRIRPKGALVRTTRSHASGPISYMRVFDRSCETVESAGARRGAQMGVLRCDHPDILDFVAAKDLTRYARAIERLALSRTDAEELRRGLRSLSNFNISVAITDEFMNAAIEDREFELVHIAEPGDAIKAAGARQRADGAWAYRRVRARDLLDAIVRHTYDGAEPGVVFIDRMNADNNLWYCERIEATNPCGEQPLPDYGCCCLGSINLTRFVRDAFGAEPTFDLDGFRGTVRTAVRMLDNVLDVTFWPLPEQAREARAKRRVGLGFTGLGSALAMLKRGYGADDGVAFAAEIARAMRDEAYAASIGLAREKGAFPAFDAAQYLQSGFAQRLPAGLRTAIGAHGLRNSHLLSIAPTGTISLAFGRNVSGGIEPAFAWTYSRSKREADGGARRYDVQDFAYRRYIENGGDADSLPPYFVNAQTLSAREHLRMQAAVQPYIDSSISKTINVPEDYPFEDFKDLYLEAWRLGCKGCTTYRPNTSVGTVLSVEAKNNQPQDLDQSDPDRRLRLDKVPAPALASLKWPGRPVLPQGNPSWTYMVDGDTARFAVSIGHTEGDEPYPFEVWVNGTEQPRGLAATAKLLSMDMRSRDRGWLQYKLDLLMKTAGAPIRCPLPPAGEALTVSSATAVLARLVKLRCEQFGGFAADGPTPVLDALMSPKEPRTGTDGTLSWTVDVNNPATGDDITAVLKELVLPDGQRRPYALSLSGNYPRDFDGLCRLLSCDMRVIDPAWIGSKLAKLLNYAEPAGALLARVPGRDRSMLYPSTIAYVAALILHRYQMLGILDEAGHPLRPMGVLEDPHVRVPANADSTTEHIIKGEVCPDCAAYAVVMRDGCRHCTACGWVGECG